VPEWHLMTAALAGMAALCVSFGRLKLALPLLIAAVLPPVAQALLSAARVPFPEAPHRTARLKRRLLTAALHLLQPIARLRGRLTEGLTPWRRHGAVRLAPLWPVTTSLLCARCDAPLERLRELDNWH